MARRVPVPAYREASRSRVVSFMMGLYMLAKQRRQAESYLLELVGLVGAGSWCDS